MIPFNVPDLAEHAENNRHPLPFPVTRTPATTTTVPTTDTSFGQCVRGYIQGVLLGGAITALLSGGFYIWRHLK